MKLRHLPALQRYFGTRWLARRALYALKVRSGGLRRRLPPHAWDEIDMSELFKDVAFSRAENFHEHRRGNPPPFFFLPSDRHTYAPLLKRWDQSHNPVDEAEAIARGNFRFFAHHDVDCGFPPDWHANSLTRSTSPANAHWSEINDFGHGDIKAIWEPSRFGFAFTLVRAFWRTGNERYPEIFWQLVESWRNRNLPQQGANWKCGQEATFRAMAWCFGLYGFLESPASTPERVLAMTQMLGITADRIEANIDYAIAQANNHGISEAVGLWTIGSLCPEFTRAEKWRKRGRDILESEGRKLIYEDGAFSQHSVNYHRLMLHDYVWAMRLAELHNVPFSDGLQRRITQAGEFLYQIQDETTGAVPYYGQNDGALILPLNNCDYRDFRPAVAVTHYLANRARIFADGPWSEDLLWLFRPESLGTPIQEKGRQDFRADEGGYYTIRATDGFVFTRCAKFRHRPGQADMLHVDLWWRGQNIAVDAGTYSYNAPEAWSDALAGTAVHNTVTVDGLDQMERAGRFLWLPWAQGHVRCFKRDGTLAYFEGEHDGYARLNPAVAYRRGIVQLNIDSWLVLDALSSTGEHSHRLHWLLGDFGYEFDAGTGRISLRTDRGIYYVQSGTLEGSGDCSLVRADAQSARGWNASYYNYREPALSFALEQRASSIVFWTVFSPQQCDFRIDGKLIQVTWGAQSAAVELSADQARPVVTEIRSGEERLTIDA